MACVGHTGGVDTPPPELMSRRGSPSRGPAPKVAAALACVLAVGGAFVLFANLMALGAPLWPAVAAAAACLVLLPGVWHVLAERERRVQTGGSVRVLLRCLAVNGLVAATAMASVGPAAVWSRSKDVLARATEKAPSKDVPAEAPPAPPPPDQAGNNLEGLVPGDATWAVGISGSEALQKLVGAHGPETLETLEAMHKCHIDLGRARAVVAARANGDQMALVRAPGITDEGNLYCLVGAMGGERLVVRFDKDAPKRRFTVSGLWPQSTVTFTEIAPDTVLMVAPGWQEAVEQRLAGNGINLTQGPLAEPYARLASGSAVWSASVTQTPEGAVDLAVHADVAGERLRLVATSVPPAGKELLAKAEVDIPLAYVRGMPGMALARGAQCLVGAVAPPTGAAGKSPAGSAGKLGP